MSDHYWKTGIYIYDKFKQDRETIIPDLSVVIIQYGKYCYFHHVSINNSRKIFWLIYSHDLMLHFNRMILKQLIYSGSQHRGTHFCKQSFDSEWNKATRTCQKTFPLPIFLLICNFCKPHILAIIMYRLVPTIY